MLQMEIKNLQKMKDKDDEGTKGTDEATKRKKGTKVTNEVKELKREPKRFKFKCIIVFL